MFKNLAGNSLEKLPFYNDSFTLLSARVISA
jgi:hypothetical protein